MELYQLNKANQSWSLSMAAVLFLSQLFFLSRIWYRAEWQLNLLDRSIPHQLFFMKALFK
jgi:hypothetical protein